MIYCGSCAGSYFGKVLVPVPAPVAVPDPEFFLEQIFKNNKFVHNLDFLLLEAALFSKKLSSDF